MGDYGIKILKPVHTLGVDVFSATPKDLVILSTAESHKVAFNGSLAAGTGSFTHSLGYIPFFQAYIENSSGDLYPINGYIDDQLYDTIYTEITTSTLSVQEYYAGSLEPTHYTIYYEN